MTFLKIRECIRPACAGMSSKLSSVHILYK